MSNATAPGFAAPFSKAEMMIVAASRELAGQRVCFVGVGLPNIAVNLALDVATLQVRPASLRWKSSSNK